MGLFGFVGVVVSGCWGCLVVVCLCVVLLWLGVSFGVFVCFGCVVCWVGWVFFWCVFVGVFCFCCIVGGGAGGFCSVGGVGLLGFLVLLVVGVGYFVVLFFLFHFYIDFFPFLSSLLCGDQFGKELANLVF